MMKRSSDNQMSNGNFMETDETSDVKKAKMDANKPSRVLHIRGIPADATEAEVIHLGLPFGRMTNLVMARKKNQALLEVEDIEVAQNIVKYYSERPAQMRSRTVHIQFSNHEQLKTDQNVTAQAALQAAESMQGANMDGVGTVLRIIVDNMIYPITVDVLKQIFSKFGQVLKIVTFNKNNTFQALLQFSDPIAAQAAKTLNGQNIYNGCCTLRIDSSKLTELQVKYNNEKSWDYTNPNLLSGDPAHAHMENMGDGILGAFTGGPMFNNFGGAGGNPGGFGGMPRMPGFGGGMGGMGMMSGMGGMGMGGSAAGAMGVGGMGGMAGGMGMGGMSGMGMGMGMGGMGLMSGMGGGMGHMGGSGMMNMGAVGGNPVQHGAGGAGTVVIVSNLSEDEINPDAVFTLFGNYGMVLRVKILYNKKDTALIQFADPVQAQHAIASLDKIHWKGKILKVSLSKHTNVQLPREGLPDSWMTKDFTSSQQHRFKNLGPKSYTNNYPPTSTLHLSNIPDCVSADELTSMFSQYGDVVNFKFFEKDRKMALIQLDSQEHAVDALVGLHNHRFEGGNYLRVSFTKSVIN